MESYFKTKSIFSLISKWKWHLLTITVVAAILGVVFSCPYFIHPKFKSSATLYPANIICLSDESESEQMLEILESDNIKFNIIEQYSLYSHYGIDSTDNGSLAKMMSYYENNGHFNILAHACYNRRLFSYALKCGIVKNIGFFCRIVGFL